MPENEEEKEVIEETQNASEENQSAQEDQEVILENVTFEEAEEKKEVKKEEAKPDDPTEKRLAELEKSHQSASTHIKELQRALHQTRQENKQLKEGKGKESEFLTDEQVKAILEEHGNDWATVLRVVNHQAAKAASKAKAETVNDVETKQIKERFTNFLKNDWPETLQEGSEIHGHIQQAKTDFRIEDHPLGDFLAAAAITLTNWKPSLEAAKKQARDEALKEKAEDSRKKVVKQSGLSASKGSAAGKGTTSSIPANIAEKAKQLGLNERQRAIYAKLVGKPRMSASVEA
jgi:hypothetical protein